MALLFTRRNVMYLNVNFLTFSSNSSCRWREEMGKDGGGGESLLKSNITDHGPVKIIFSSTISYMVLHVKFTSSLVIVKSIGAGGQITKRM